MAAVKLMVNGEPVGLGGVPLSTPVGERLAQLGRPVALNVGAGLPVALTVKLSGWPTAKIALSALVMEGDV